MQVLGSLLILVQILVQLVFSIHVIKTGRSFWWLLVIWFFWGIGSVLYFVVEMLPDLKHNQAVKRFGSDIVSAVNPTRNVRQLEEELEISDTVKNRQLLAQAYVGAGRYAEAIDMYQSCLKGIYQDDPPIMLALAVARFLNGSYQQAKETVARLTEIDQNFRPMERRLLLGRTLEALDDLDAALEEYGTLARQYPGEEAKCRYGMLLARCGQREKAREVFSKILLSARRSPRYYRKAQRQWINIARQNLRR